MEKTYHYAVWYFGPTHDGGKYYSSHLENWELMFYGKKVLKSLQ